MSSSQTSNAPDRQKSCCAPSADKSERSDARKFGIVLAAILLIIGTLHLHKGHLVTFGWLSAASAISFIYSVFFTRQFIPAYHGLTKVLHAIGWFNSRLILSVIFFLVITPMALVMKLFGKDTLDKKIKKTSQTYWVKKQAHAAGSVEQYEKQY